jgi:hypothetical protein
VAGSNYDVNIKLDVRKINQQINNLERRIKKLNAIAQGKKGDSKILLKNERDKAALLLKQERAQKSINRELAKTNKLKKENLNLTKRTTASSSSIRGKAMGPASPVRLTSDNNVLPGAPPKPPAFTRDDISGALISGAFPLLFGQGPLGAAAGIGGGLIGSKLGGQTGGFAGGLVATAALQTIQQTISAISQLGQAMGPFAQNTDAVTAAIGLQGSAQEARIKLIEESQGKTAAFNASMKLMGTRIGEDGIEKLKNFGESTRLIGSEMAIAVTKLQAFGAGIANFLLRISGARDRLSAAAATRTVADAAALGNTTAQGLVDRRAAIEGMRGQGGSGAKKAALLEELQKEEQIFAIREKAKTQADTMSSKFNDMVKQIKDQESTTARILELRKEGLNPELAQTIANLEKEGEISKDNIQFEVDALLKKQREVGILGKEDQERLTTLEASQDAIDEQVNGLSESVQETQRLNEAAKITQDAFDQLKDTIVVDIGNGIKGLIRGTQTLNEALSNVLNKMADAFLNMAIFGNAAGSSVTGGIFGALGFAANGGPVKSGKPYIVGEKGPELFTPGVSGNITPNHKLGGSTSVVVNVDASGSSVEGNDQSANQLGELIAAAVQSEIVKQKMDGGLLS